MLSCFSVPEVISIIADIVSASAFIGMIASIVHWLRNRVTSKHIHVSTTLIKPPHFANRPLYFADFDIYIRNYTDSQFYVHDIALFFGERRFNLYRRELAYKDALHQFVPFKVEPYQPLTLHAVIEIAFNYPLPTKGVLRLDVAQKPFNFEVEITPHRS